MRTVQNNGQAKEVKQENSVKTFDKAEQSAETDVNSLQNTINKLKNEKRTRKPRARSKEAAGPHGKAYGQQAPKKPRLYICQHCGLSVNSSTSLNRHLRVHTGERPFSCHVCGKTFARSSTLRCHERTHTGERPYSCAHCHLAFAQSSSLRDHQKIHSGLRAFVCSTCGKSFTKKNGLTRHEAIHNGIKPHRCGYCKKSFVQVNALIEHERIHTGQKPFRCSLCPWDFAQSSQLRSHMKTHRNSTAIRRPRKRKESPAYLTISGIGSTPDGDSHSAGRGDSLARSRPECGRAPLASVTTVELLNAVDSRKITDKDKSDLPKCEDAEEMEKSSVNFLVTKPVICNDKKEIIADKRRTPLQQAVQLSVHETKTSNLLGVQTMQSASTITQGTSQSVAQEHQVEVTPQLVQEVICIAQEEVEGLGHVILVQVPDKAIKQEI